MDTTHDYAVRVTNLSKVYQVIHSPWEKFLHYVFNKQCGQEFHALQDINFEVKKGETFGIIGTNGSGKSTLLQIISGIIPQTKGEVHVSGKVSALLELGSGFNPENTGYENIYLNAAILGVKKENIDKKCASIIEFADIGDFINEPVKTYSSGMFIRLAFAVAINVEADIIIIDEALAVGDIFFRQKCYAKLNELKASGKTIILVSHGMNEVEQFCDRALLISHGHQIMLGKSDVVVQKYYMLNQGEDDAVVQQQVKNESATDTCEISAENATFFAEKWHPRDDMYFDLSKSIEQNNGMAHYLRVGLFDENGHAKRLFKQGETAYFYSEIVIDQPIEVPINGIVLVNQKNIIVHGRNSFQTDATHYSHMEKGKVLCSCIKLELELEEGEYTFEVGCSSLSKQIYDIRGILPHEELNRHLLVLADRRSVGAFAIQGKKEPSPSALKFYGLVGLKGEFDWNVN